jgi:DNA-directed RNA polymerase specialized sigma24 family protein
MCLSNLTDDELIDRVAKLPWNAGGSNAFWTLWLRYQDWIEQKIRARESLAWNCGCTPDEFCERVENRVREKIKSLKRYRGGNVEGLLERIINTAAIDEYRYWKRRPTVDPKEALGQQPTDSPLADDEVLDLLTYRTGMFYPSPERISEAKDLSEKIQIMLEQMAAESKEGLKRARALREHYMEGKNVKEIVQDRGVDERTVYRWLKDGREAAKRILKETFQITSLEDL